MTRCDGLIVKHNAISSRADFEKSIGLCILTSRSAIFEPLFFPGQRPDLYMQKLHGSYIILLLNLLGPRGIHQSSDYRLTDLATRRPIEDQFGSKQLAHLASIWSAQISFTGFAQIGQRKTRDWILECLRRQPQSADAATALSALASRAAVELRCVRWKDWFLTIVATVRERSATRLFVVSCIDRPAKPPLNQPLDHFEVSEVSTATPRVLIFGSRRAVTNADRKLLKQLSRSTLDQAEIRRALARINVRSAIRSNGTVGEACLVTSAADGSSASENYGRTPGITVDIAGSAEAHHVISEAQLGLRPVFVQSKRVSHPAGFGVK